MNVRIQERENRLAGRVCELRAYLRQVEPAILARNTGSGLDDRQLSLKMWGKNIAIPLPELVAQNTHTGQELDALEQAIIAYHLYTADGARPAGQWISFSELPEGRFYIQAFQGYTGRKLAQAFGNDQETFADAALMAGGQPFSFGDLAFRFQALPFIPLLVICWLGDEEVAPSYRILFDAQVPHHLPADGCAILGSRLTHMLLPRIPASGVLSRVDE